MSVPWEWVAGAVALIGVIGVVMHVRRLMRLRRADVACVPLLVEQVVDIDAAGPMLLHAEGPRLTRGFGGLGFHIEDVEDGRPIPLNRMILAWSSSGRRRSRLCLRSFTVDRPGPVSLRVQGMAAGATADGLRLVITHDRRRALIRCILGLVLSAMVIAAGLAASILTLVL